MAPTFNVHRRLAYIWKARVFLTFEILHVFRGIFFFLFTYRFLFFRFVFIPIANFSALALPTIPNIIIQQ